MDFMDVNDAPFWCTKEILDNSKYTIFYIKFITAIYEKQILKLCSLNYNFQITFIMLWCFTCTENVFQNKSLNMIGIQ